MAYPPPGPGYPPGNVSGYPPGNMPGYPPSNAPGYPPQPGGSYPPGNTTVSPCTFCSTFSASIKVAQSFQIHGYQSTECGYLPFLVALGGSIHMSPMLLYWKLCYIPIVIEGSYNTRKMKRPNTKNWKYNMKNCYVFNLLWCQWWRCIVLLPTTIHDYLSHSYVNRTILHMSLYALACMHVLYIHPVYTNLWYNRILDLGTPLLHPSINHHHSMLQHKQCQHFIPLNLQGGIPHLLEGATLHLQVSDLAV